METYKHTPDGELRRDTEFKVGDCVKHVTGNMGFVVDIIRSTRVNSVKCKWVKGGLAGSVCGASQNNLTRIDPERLEDD